MKRLIVVAVTILFLFLLFYMPFVHYTDFHQAGIRRNLFTGEVSVDARAGFHVTAPWIAVARVDTRPVRVCVTTTAQTYNCKLVQFVPNQARLFVAVQGFYYYWWANRFSFNSGYVDEYRGMKDILRGYAYGHKYPFIQILDESQ